MVTLITLLILVTALEAEKGDNSILGTARSSEQTASLRCVDQEDRRAKSQLWRRLFPPPATPDTCEWGTVKLHPMLDWQSLLRLNLTIVEMPMVQKTKHGCGLVFH